MGKALSSTVPPCLFQSLFHADIIQLLSKISKKSLEEKVDPLCRRPHQSLASVGVAALVRLAVRAGDRMSPNVWQELLETVAKCAVATQPDIERLVSTSPDRRSSLDSMTEDVMNDQSAWSVQSPSHSPRSILSRQPSENSQVNYSQKPKSNTRNHHF